MSRAAIVVDGIVTNVVVIGEGSSEIADVVHINPGDGPVSIGWSHDGVAFAPPARAIEALRAERITTLTAACRAAIVGEAATGAFACGALGADHRYPNGPTDQTNLLGSILAAVIDTADPWTTPFWCRDAEGEWAMRPHDRAQIREVGLAAKAHVENCQLRLAALVAEVEGAVDVATITLIEW